MNPPEVVVKGIGILCALGRNSSETLESLKFGRSGLRPVTRFIPRQTSPLPVGEIPYFLSSPEREELPPTHQFARIAADQAMSGVTASPDAIVLGITTGGMAITENLLRSGCTDPERYQFHAIASVAADLARRYRCKGPLITLSTACSSGSAAIALALAMIRSGGFKRVLTGGADSLCLLTYYGFKSLQLIDPQGSRPLDEARHGMSVAEGAGMLLLEAGSKASPGIRILGAGLSCDAHHPAQPHPEGRGALAAMQAALADAALTPNEIDYINLHGTGTTDNDRSEAIAIKRLFAPNLPSLSSLKGATGHSLAAAGAIEAVVSVLAIQNRLIPANCGCQTPDPALGLFPVLAPMEKPIQTVLSNSFGFGGNNAAIVIGKCSTSGSSTVEKYRNTPFLILGASAVTAAGHTRATIQRLAQQLNCSGKLSEEALCEGLPLRTIRRVKRLSQIAMALSSAAIKEAGGLAPRSVFFGTAWGSLSETKDFLTDLFESDEKFSSPTDFIGSVHNAAAGQIALLTQATGANLTVSGGDYSFEQALFAAQMIAVDTLPILVLAAEEGNGTLSHLFDTSVLPNLPLSDGGGALLLKRDHSICGPQLELKYYKTDFESLPDAADLVHHLGGQTDINERYGLILAGMPGSMRELCQQQMDKFMELAAYRGQIIDYRRLTGEYAATSAVAVVFASILVNKALTPCPGLFPPDKAVLILGLGNALTAIEVTPA